MYRLRQLSTAHVLTRLKRGTLLLPRRRRLQRRSWRPRLGNILPRRDGRPMSSLHEQPAYHAYCSPPSATAPPFEGESLLSGGTR